MTEWRQQNELFREIWEALSSHELVWPELFKLINDSSANVENILDKT